jgi:hypothetical protein
MTDLKTFEAEVLFHDPSDAYTAIAMVTALGHKVESNSTVFVPSREGRKLPGDIETCSYSIKIVSDAAGASERCRVVTVIVDTLCGTWEQDWVMA